MFSYDSKFFTLLARIGDLILLNILYVICCIPVVTIGASTTAMYAVTKKIAGNKEGYILRTYFKEFKENFFRSTAIWLIMSVIFTIAVGDYMVAQFIQNSTVQSLYKGAVLLIMLLVIGATMYALTLQCTFINTLKNTLKNAAMMVVLHFPWTLVIVLVTISPVLAILFLTKFWQTEVLLMICIWFSGAAYINSFILNHIYKRYME